MQTQAYQIASLTQPQPVELTARAGGIYINGRGVSLFIDGALVLDDKLLAIVQDEDMNLYVIDSDLLGRAHDAHIKAPLPKRDISPESRRFWSSISELIKQHNNENQPPPQAPQQVTITISNRSHLLTVNGERPGAEVFYLNDVVRLVFFGRPSICIAEADYRKLRPAVKGKRKPVSMTFDTVPFPEDERTAMSTISDHRIKSDIQTGKIAEPPA
jgi:hypothetical protein